MGEVTKISWVDASFNPWRGCQRVSPGCENCYAETLSLRWGHHLWGPGSDHPAASEHYWKQPLVWNRRAEQDGVRRRVFCASMADVFEDRRDLDVHRARLWDLIAATPNLDWLLLTKRPEQMRRLTPASWQDAWPTNVWAGTSTENQEWLAKRIVDLLDIPAVVRFLSAEPLLGPLDLRPWLPGLSWVIVGGESGPHRRAMDLSWAMDIRDQCEDRGTAFFFKQTSALYAGSQPDALGQFYHAWPEVRGR